MLKIYLKETNEDNYEEYYKVRSCSSDVYWNGYTNPPEKESFFEGYKKRMSSSRFTQNEDRINYLVCIPNVADAIGFVQFIRREKAIEIGYTIIDEYQGLGYGTQALKKALEYIKNKYKGEKIILQIRDDNIASQSIAKKNGFDMSDKFKEVEYPSAGRIKLRTWIYNKMET